MNDKDKANIRTLFQFLEDNRTKNNDYKFQIRVVVNKTLNGKFKVINLSQDAFDKLSNTLYSLINDDENNDSEDLLGIDLNHNKL